MTAADPDADPLLALLARERAHLLAEVARVPRARQGEAIVPGRWSVAEVVEHVARVERGVVRMLEAGRAGALRAPATPPLGAPLADAVVGRLRDRGEPLEAPERVRPTGAPTPEDALAELAQARAALLDAYRTAGDEVLDGGAYPHPYLGPLTLRGWVEMSAHHDARHAAQVAELAAASVDSSREPAVQPHAGHDA